MDEGGTGCITRGLYHYRVASFSVFRSKDRDSIILGFKV
jgi:hypothetical protein